jgi:SAM-dependent methyltransferase
MVEAMMPEYSLTCRMKPYIQPFERTLALRELAVTAKAQPTPIESDARHEPLEFRIVTTVNPEKLLMDLAYWESVRNGRTGLTAQVLREASVNLARQGAESVRSRVLRDRPTAAALPSRRYLRYGPHGLHEYRGKFFPQLVRALINIADLRKGAIVLDPMCGSGTTPVEVILSGYRARGLDLNPLSVLVSRAKCSILGFEPAPLADVYEGLRSRLLAGKRPSGYRDLRWFNSLPVEDQDYLRAWFAKVVLVDLDLIVQTIGNISSPILQDFFRVVLSNILRRVSYQKPEDLRVRREMKPDDHYDPIDDFLRSLDSAVASVLAFLHTEGSLSRADWEVSEGDARSAVQKLKQLAGSIDAIITSPPYAMALPYLDTDRLSLCYLGLLPRPAHRRRDAQMIGNREVTNSQRDGLWSQYLRDKALLPTPIQDVIERVNSLNSSTTVGFRRRNLPALLAKYFLDMGAVLGQMASLLRPGGHAFIVVGSNHTIAGGQRIDIPTADMLADLAVLAGLTPREHVSMELLVSRDIFKKNAGNSETILHFVR